MAMSLQLGSCLVHLGCRSEIQSLCDIRSKYHQMCDLHIDSYLMGVLDASNIPLCSKGR